MCVCEERVGLLETALAKTTHYYYIHIITIKTTHTYTHTHTHRHTHTLRTFKFCGRVKHLC